MNWHAIMPIFARTADWVCSIMTDRSFISTLVLAVMA